MLASQDGDCHKEERHARKINVILQSTHQACDTQSCNKLEVRFFKTQIWPKNMSASSNQSDPIQ